MTVSRPIPGMSRAASARSASATARVEAEIVLVPDVLRARPEEQVPFEGRRDVDAHRRISGGGTG